MDTKASRVVTTLVFVASLALHGEAMGQQPTIGQRVERRGDEIIVCGDLESAQLVVERYSPACIVTDVRLSSPFRFEGLDLVADVRRRMGEQRIVVMTGARTEGLQDEALARGAYAVLRKPFTSAELRCGSILV